MHTWKKIIWKVIGYWWRKSERISRKKKDIKEEILNGGSLFGNAKDRSWKIDPEREKKECVVESNAGRKVWFLSEKWLRCTFISQLN